MDGRVVGVLGGVISSALVFRGEGCIGGVERCTGESLTEKLAGWAVFSLGTVDVLFGKKSDELCNCGYSSGFP